MKATKSATVRTLIQAAKANGATAADESLIEQVMTLCSFKRQLARAYINNNFSKVEATADAVEATVEAVIEVEATASNELDEALAKLAAKRAKDAARKRAKRAAAKEAA